MKKKWMAAIGAVALISICSVTAFAANGFRVSDFAGFFEKNKAMQEDETIAAKVNGEPIYQSAVDRQLEFSKLSYALSMKQIQEMDIPEAQRQELLKQQKNSPKTADDILEDLIKETVLLQEAERQGISVSDKEARAFALEQYTILKNLASTSDSSVNRKNVEFIQQYMLEMNLTEEQYMDKVTSIYKNMLIINKLYETTASQSNAPNAESTTQNDLDRLLAKANIVYMD